MQSFVISRSKMPSLTDLTIPYPGEVESTTTTISPGLKFFLNLDHFCLACISVKYSSPPEQVNYVLYLPPPALALENSPGGTTGWEFSRRMWLGVSGSRSKRSEDENGEW